MNATEWQKIQATAALIDERIRKEFADVGPPKGHDVRNNVFCWHVQPLPDMPPATLGIVDRRMADFSAGEIIAALEREGAFEKLRQNPGGRFLLAYDADSQRLRLVPWTDYGQKR